MVKVLLKKQLSEIFRTYLYDAKKNKKRSNLSIFLCFAFFIILMVGVLGGMFTVLSVLLCGPLLQAGVGWLYFAVMGLVAIFFGAFGSVFNTFSGLYLAKDNDLLLSMPIPVSVIMGSRLLGTYIMGLMYSGVISIPAVVVYLVVGKLSVSTIVCGLVYVFLISVFDLELSCVLGWVVAKISQKLKNKSFISVIVALAFFGLYYFINFKAGSLVQEFIANAYMYGMNVKGSVYPLYLFGRIGEGDWLATLVYVAAIGALFAVMWAVLSRSFIKIVTTKSDSRVKGAKASFEGKSASSALFSKELTRFTSNANYMLNCGLGILMLMFFAGAIVVKGDMVRSICLQLLGSEGDPSVVALCGVVCCVASMVYVVVPSISLEGRNLWILQVLPVSPWQVLSAKIKVQFLLTAVPSALCLVAMAFVVPSSIVTFVLGCVFTMLFMFVFALFGMFVGLKMPILNWTSEIIAIKQSIGVMIALLVGFVYSAAFVLLFILFGRNLGSIAYLCISIAVTAGVGAVLLSWLKGRGCRIFAEL